MDQIVITYPPSLPTEDVDELEAGLGELGVSVRRQAVQPPKFVAAVELLLATSLILYFTRPYFDAFLSAAGKSHYEILGRATRKCWNLFFGKKPKYTLALVDRKGQEQPSPFSLAFSVVAEASNGSRVKLLIEKSVSKAKMRDMVTIFLKEMAGHHAGVPGLIDTMLEEGPPLGGSYYLVRVDPKIKELVRVDVVPR